VRGVRLRLFADQDDHNCAGGGARFVRGLGVGHLNPEAIRTILAAALPRELPD